MKKLTLILGFVLFQVIALLFIVPFFIYEALKGFPAFMAGYLKAWKHASDMFIEKLKND